MLTCWVILGLDCQTNGYTFFATTQVSSRRLDQRTKSGSDLLYRVNCDDTPNPVPPHYIRNSPQGFRVRTGRGVRIRPAAPRSFPSITKKAPREQLSYTCYYGAESNCRPDLEFSWTVDNLRRVSQQVTRRGGRLVKEVW
jgi:hypothetical protein